MTLADVGRSRGKGGDVRDRPPDRLPQPRAIAREARELRLRLSVLVAVYDVEHDALASLGSADIHVMSSPELTTVEAAVDDRENQAARDRCREAVMFLRRAAANVNEALEVFGPDAEQPTHTSPDSVVSQSTFERAVNRRRHRQREEELRA